MNENSNWYQDARSNIPLIAGVIAAGLIAMRILAVSEYNLETAYAILQDAGTGSVLAGATISVLQQLPVIIVTGAILYFPGLKYYQGPAKMTAAWLVIVSGIIILLVTPIINLFSVVVIIVITVIITLVAHIQRKRIPEEVIEPDAKSDPPARRPSLAERIADYEHSKTPQGLLDLLVQQDEYAKKVLKLPTSNTKDRREFVLSISRLLRGQLVVHQRLKECSELDKNNAELSRLLPEIRQRSESLDSNTDELMSMQGRMFGELESKLSELEALQDRLTKARARTPHFMFFLASVILAGFILGPSIWLPARNIYIKGRPSFVGYIIGESGSATVILSDDPRVILNVDSNKITKTVLCNSGPFWLTETLPALTNSHTYVSCIFKHSPKPKQ